MRDSRVAEGHPYSMNLAGRTPSGWLASFLHSYTPTCSRPTAITVPPTLQTAGHVPKTLRTSGGRARCPGTDVPAAGHTSAASVYRVRLRQVAVAPNVRLPAAERRKAADQL